MPLRNVVRKPISNLDQTLKCLTEIVSVDPKILSQELIAKSIQRRMQDMATSVREAAVDLIGKFILTRPEVAEQYYKMLTERILDTGLVSLSNLIFSENQNFRRIVIFGNRYFREIDIFRESIFSRKIVLKPDKVFLFAKGLLKFFVICVLK